MKMNQIIPSEIHNYHKLDHILLELLLRTDYHITCLDRLDFAGNMNRLAEIKNAVPTDQHHRVKTVFHDLKAEINPQLVKQIGPVNFIVHVAAGSHVNRSIADPRLFVQDNVLGTCNLLEYARYHCPDLVKFINFGTDEVFGAAPWGVSYNEYDRYNSCNPYAATKAGAEELCVAYENTFKMPIYCTHTMNVFGERQNPEKFLGIVMKALLQDQQVTIHGDLDSNTSGLRTWIHANDVADAVLFIMNLPHGKFALASDHATCPKFNVVGQDEISNLEIAQRVATIMNKTLKYQIVGFDQQRPGHDFRYSMSNKYMASLGWTPKLDFDQRLKQHVNWTLANQHWLWM